MSADWTWLYLDAAGNLLDRDRHGDRLPAKGFPTQSDAESFLGESWRDLLEAGVESVSLREADTVVYGPMSLHPTD